MIVGNNNAVNYCIIDENAFNGIYITGNTNKVIGCFIGTDSQTADKGNGAFGVEIYGGTRNDLGPSTPAGPDNIAAADRNFISRNKGGGVAITGTGVDSMTPQDNVVGNNDIGVSDTLGGTTGNGGPGVVLTGQAHGNLIGYQLLGGVGGENVIAGNAGSGVVIENASPSNQISGNLIGIRDGGVRTGEVVGNHGYGVEISDAVEGNSNCNTIGGTIGTLPRGEQNVISGNTAGGVHLEGAVSYNKVKGNLIGTDTQGESAWDGKGNPTGNGTASGGGDGVFIEGASNNTIGGDVHNPNTISGNYGNGVRVVTTADPITGKAYITLARKIITRSGRHIGLMDVGSSS